MKAFIVFVYTAPPDQGAIMSHRGRHSWSLRTARKHALDCVKRLGYHKAEVHPAENWGTPVATFTRTPASGN